MPMLEVERLSKSFGGLTATNAVSFSVEEGQILAIIGPNGAGKSTLFNLITGVYRPSAGDVRFRGRSIVGKSPDAIVQLGIARTFQNLRLFTHLSVLDNVLTAQHHALRSNALAAILRTPGYRRKEREMRRIAEEKLAFFGPRLMSFRLNQPVYVLSYANRRRTEMARAMATGARLLLLDEPSAGMNPTETQEITEIIKRMRDEGGYTIVVVEHKMNLVGGCSDRVIVLDYGQKISEGPYGTVVNDPKVIEAYLGKKAADDRRGAEGLDA